MWNPFRKNTDPNKIGMLQKIAMKKVMSMNPEERNKVIQEAFRPENRNKILAVMEQMKKSGQVTDEQIEMAKKQFGL